MSRRTAKYPPLASSSPFFDWDEGYVQVMIRFRHTPTKDDLRVTKERGLRGIEVIGLNNMVGGYLPKNKLKAVSTLTSVDVVTEASPAYVC